MSVHISRKSASSSQWKAFFPIVDAVYVMLALSVCVLAGCVPLLVACFLPLPVAETYPWTCVALALSAPGIAAAFAIYRDHPVLRPSHFDGVKSFLSGLRLHMLKKALEWRCSVPSSPPT